MRFKRSASGDEVTNLGTYLLRGRCAEVQIWTVMAHYETTHLIRYADLTGRTALFPGS